LQVKGKSIFIADEKTLLRLIEDVNLQMSI